MNDLFTEFTSAETFWKKGTGYAHKTSNNQSKTGLVFFAKLVFTACMI